MSLLQAVIKTLVNRVYPLLNDTHLKGVKFVSKAFLLGLNQYNQSHVAEFEVLTIVTATMALKPFRDVAISGILTVGQVSTAAGYNDNPG